jgi:hypothetical protein
MLGMDSPVARLHISHDVEPPTTVV